MRMVIIKASFFYITGVGLTTSILNTKYTTADLSTWNGLVCYYRGDTLQDSSPESNGDMTPIGGGPHYESINSAPFSPSTPRNVFRLDGSSFQSFYLKAPVPSLPIANSPRTVMGWVRIDQTGQGWASPFSYGGPQATAKTFVLSICSDLKSRIDLHYGVESDGGIIENDYRPFGVWKHYAVTSDGTNLLAYVNGVLLYQGTFLITPDTGLTDFHIGVRSNGDQPPIFYGAVAEIAVFDRALTQDEITNVVNGDTAGGGGDPHLFGFGGVYFTWQGHCDIILTMAPTLSTTHPDVQIHARTRRTRQWSAIEAIAFKVGKETGEIESDQGNLFMNGNNVKTYQSDTIAVTYSKMKKRNIQYEIVFNEDKTLLVRANTRTKMVFVTISGNFSEGTVGVLGSPHKPGMFARNGTDMAGQDINQFVESWQTTADDPKLFQHDRYPQHPTKCLYKMSEIKAQMRSRHLKEIYGTTREEANAACNGHPVGPLRDFCVEDLMNTGDFESATDVFYG